MPPVVRHQTGEAHPEPRVVETRVGPVRRVHVDVRVLPRAPVPRCLVADGGIGVGKEPRVGVDEAAVAFGLGHAVAEPRPRLGEDPAHVTGDPLDLPPAVGAHAEQHDLGDAFGVALGVGESEHRTPRAAEDQPPLDPEPLTQPLDVGEQVVRGVRGQVDVGLARVRGAAAAAALVEEHDAVGGRGRRAAASTAYTPSPDHRAGPRPACRRGCRTAPSGRGSRRRRRAGPGRTARSGDGAQASWDPFVSGRRRI